MSLEHLHPRPDAIRRTTCVALALAALAASGCSTVPFYEKAAFSEPEMSFEEDPTETHFRQKVYYSREGATGGIGSGAGGGCGCY